MNSQREISCRIYISWRFMPVYLWIFGGCKAIQDTKTTAIWYTPHRKIWKGYFGVPVWSLGLCHKVCGINCQFFVCLFVVFIFSFCFWKIAVKNGTQSWITSSVHMFDMFFIWHISHYAELSALEYAWHWWLHLCRLATLMTILHCTG